MAISNLGNLCEYLLTAPCRWLGIPVQSAGRCRGRRGPVNVGWEQMRLSFGLGGGSGTNPRYRRVAYARGLQWRDVQLIRRYMQSPTTQMHRAKAAMRRLTMFKLAVLMSAGRVQRGTSAACLPSSHDRTRHLSIYSSVSRSVNVSVSPRTRRRCRLGLVGAWTALPPSAAYLSPCFGRLLSGCCRIPDGSRSAAPRPFRTR